MWWIELFGSLIRQYRTAFSRVDCSAPSACFRSRPKMAEGGSYRSPGSRSRSLPMSLADGVALQEDSSVAAVTDAAGEPAPGQRPCPANGITTATCTNNATISDDTRTIHTATGLDGEPCQQLAAVKVFDLSPISSHPSPIESSGPPSMSTSMTSMTASWSSMTSEGMHCYGNERQMLSELGRFYNNKTLSDLRLRVGDKVYRTHKLVLARASDVLEHMLCSSDWKDASKHEVELHEEPDCQRLFSKFLRYLYTCHVLLNQENALPILVLADKYNVIDLRSVCVQFARLFVIPKLQLKDVFHVWFQYATRCRHRLLISACVSALSERMDDITLSSEWETEWVNLETDQLTEFLKSSELTVKNEWELWMAVLRWLQSPSFPHRVHDLEANLAALLPHVRFPMMSAEQLCELERHPLAEQFPSLFLPHINQAYKYLSLPLAARASVREFSGSSFLLRNYSEIRWDKRLVIYNYGSYTRCSEVSLRFATKACSFPPQNWDWELKVYPKGFSSTTEDCRMILYSNMILDHPRPVEYLLAVVDEQRALVVVSGKKNFCKNRYSADTEMEKKLSLADLNAIDSPYLVNDNLILQVSIKPMG